MDANQSWWWATSTAWHVLIEAVVFDIANQYDLTTHGVSFDVSGGFTIIYRNNETRQPFSIEVERPELIDIVSGDLYTGIDRNTQRNLGILYDEDGEPC